MRYLIVLLGLLFSVSALANTSVNINYVSVGQHDGPGLSMSLPGVKLVANQSLTGPYSIRYSGIWSKSTANEATFWDSNVDALVKYNLLVPNLYTIAGVGIGRTAMNTYGNFDMSAWNVYAVANLEYVFNSNVNAELTSTFGRDFDTQLTGYNTIGGLSYSFGVKGNYKVGPGFFTLGVSYGHMPLTTQYDYHLTTDQFYGGYTIMFG